MADLWDLSATTDDLIDGVGRVNLRDATCVRKDINSFIERTCSLIDAVRSGNKALCDLLITSGTDVNSFQGGTNSALRVAVERRDQNMVEYLLSKGAMIHQERDKSILLDAAYGGNTTLCDMLISAGADINTVHGGLTPLRIAVRHGNLDMAKYLISKGAKVDSEHNRASLIAAVRSGNKALCELILSSGADVNSALEMYTPLRAATMNGNLDMVKYLISKGAHVSCENNQGILIDAVEIGNRALCGILITAGADVNAIRQGDTPLRAAVRNNNFEIAKFLVSAGVQVNSKYNQGVLVSAIECGNKALCQFLVCVGADVNLTMKRETPLRAAVRSPRRSLEMVEYLISNGADVRSADNQGILIDAVETGNISVCGLLISAGADLNESTEGRLRSSADDFELLNTDTPLRAAVRAKNVEIATYLIAKGALLNSESNRGVLVDAVKSGDRAVCEFLIAAGVDLNVKDEPTDLTPLRAAAREGSLEMVKFLISIGAQISSKDNCGIVIDAVQSGNKALCELIIQDGADVNESQKWDGLDDGFSGSVTFTPLRVAAACGNLEIVELLISKGAQVNSEHHHGILVDAVESGNKALCEWLLSAGANVNESQERPCSDDNYSGPLTFTPLRVAAACGHMDIVEYLISKGAHVNSDLNHIILIQAVESGNTSLVELLVSAGADVNATYDGETPLRVAMRGGHLEIAEYLKLKGAKAQVNFR